MEPKKYLISEVEGIESDYPINYQFISGEMKNDEDFKVKVNKYDSENYFDLIPFYKAISNIL